MAISIEYSPFGQHGQPAATWSISQNIYTPPAATPHYNKMNATILHLITVLNFSLLGYQAWKWHKSQYLLRTKCIMYIGPDYKRCTSWSVTNLQNAAHKSMDEFTEECTNSCKAVDRPCELVRVVEGAVQYSCITQQELPRFRASEERLYGSDRIPL